MQEHGVDETEERRIDADAEAQNEHRRHREAPVAAQPPHRVPCVAGEVIDQPGSACVPRLLLPQLSAAERAQRLLPRVERIDSGCGQPLGLAIDVIAKLLVQVGLAPAAEDDRGEARPEAGPDPHGSRSSAAPG
jgi:hypothetical protein